MDSIDLTSDVELTPPKTKGQFKPATFTPDSAIRLLSSDDDQKTIDRLRDSANNAHSRHDAAQPASIEDQDDFFPRDTDAGFPGSEDIPLALLAEQISPQTAERLRRPRRAAIKRPAEDFELDLSQFGDLQTQTDADFQLLSQGDQSSPDAIQQKISPKRKRGGRLTEEEKAARAAEKEQQKLAKAKAREAKKREREAEKVQKQAQRAQDKISKKRETGKTALVDTTLHLDPELAKHRLGRDIMQKLEDLFGVPGVEGPGPENLKSWCPDIFNFRAKAITGHLVSKAVFGNYDSFGTAEEFVNDILRDRLASVLQTAVQKCPNCTLGIIVDGLEHYLVQRQRKDFQSNGPGNGGFNRAFVDEFLGKLPCNWPGVRHVIVPDSASAAEHIAGLTRAIAEQPFRAETAYVMSFGAGKPDTQASNELLKKAPLPHKDRETFFKALMSIPRLGPQAAHAVSGLHVSMGALIQTYMSGGQ